jgi:hypothetical protein
MKQGALEKRTNPLFFKNNLFSGGFNSLGQPPKKSGKSYSNLQSACHITKNPKVDLAIWYSAV